MRNSTMNGRCPTPRRIRALVAAALLTLAASTHAQKPDADKAKLAAELAATLQACSYDGSPISFSPPDLSKGGDSGTQVVAQIMRYTGLPANFVVVEGQVPNAAAMIMLDQNKVPRRVIAYNPGFMGEVIKATRANNWAPASIMAHEIGHHLSGHTIVPGGSQPPIELESDKFSGFVLYKMGAPLNDAKKAIATLVPEQEGTTHPGRSRRLAAIENGWREACTLEQGAGCSGAGKAQGGTPRLVAPARPDAPAASNVPQPAVTQPAESPRAVAKGRIDTLPKMDDQAMPSKGTQFIYDEFGYLDAEIRDKYEKAMFEHAQKTGVEIVTLLVDDLDGRSAQDYAWAAMRQLRVGKLDVGNGAVLVVAPAQGETAVAYGPGVAMEMDFHDKAAQLKRWIDAAWKPCVKDAACRRWTDNLMGTADHIRRQTASWDWTIAYPSLQAIREASAAESEREVSPRDSKVWRRIVRFSGTLEKLDPPAGVKSAWVNVPKLRDGKRRAALLRSDEGLTTMVYFNKEIEALMPGGALREGLHYTMLGREGGLSRNDKDTQSIELMSYNVLQ